MNLVWVTRGHAWGNRILRTPEGVDGLAVYEAAIPKLMDEDEGIARWHEGYVLRFRDPEGRRDRAGRPIIHEVVALDTRDAPSVKEAISAVWKLIRDDYAEMWDGE